MRFRRRRGLGSGGREHGGADDEIGHPDTEATDSGPSRGIRGSRRRSRPGGGGGSFSAGSSGRRVLVSALLLVGLFGLGYLAAAEWLFPGGSAAEREGDVARVPDLVGLGTDEATKSLGEVGLTLAVSSRVPHPKAPEGAVIAQTPLPGQFARPGAPVQVTVSSGPEHRTIPDLRGLSARQGQIVLERLGFRTRMDSTRSAIQRGQVVGSRPDAGTDIELPADVTVLVSRGPAVARVPDLSGRHVEDIPAALQDAGLALGEVTYDPSAFAAAGRVIAQSPPPGFALRRGGSVSITVAGPPRSEPADSSPSPLPDSGSAGPPDRRSSRSAGGSSPGGR